jgi:hypothetical protein
MAELKSQMCRAINPSMAERFGADLQTTLGLDDDELMLLAKHALLAESAAWKDEKESAVGLAARELGRSEGEIKLYLGVTQFMIHQFQSTGRAGPDSPEDVAGDFVRMGVVPQGKETALSHMFTFLRDEVRDWLDPVQRRRHAARTGAPYLEGIAASSDLRVVTEGEFDPRTEVDDYSPVCEGVVAIGLVSLTFDQGPAKEVSFQVDRSTLRLLSNTLRALEKELDAAQERFGFEELSTEPREWTHDDRAGDTD